MYSKSTELCRIVSDTNVTQYSCDYVSPAEMVQVSCINGTTFCERIESLQEYVLFSERLLKTEPNDFVCACWLDAQDVVDAETGVVRP